MNLQKELKQEQQAWSNIAEGYDKFVTPTGNWALPKKALKLAGVRPGMRFLDVASGSGALSLSAARLGAEVLAVDISPVMIEKLNERARKESLTNINGRVMDGHNLDLKDNTFDIAGSQFGVMLFPDLLRGIREMVRVTKPGGRVFLVVYGQPKEVEFLDFFVNAMKTVIPGFDGPPMDPPLLPFQAANPEILIQKMAEAGLKNIRVQPDFERLEFRTGKEMWEWVTNSNPIVLQLIAGLTDSQKEKIQQALDDMLRQHPAGSSPAVLKAAVNIGTGTR